jgi:hypothetical protein
VDLFYVSGEVDASATIPPLVKKRFPSETHNVIGQYT